MLALTRSPRDGADFVVASYGGISIRFTIVHVDGSQVRVAVDAPRDVKILREELIEQPPDEAA